MTGSKPFGQQRIQNEISSCGTAKRKTACNGNRGEVSFSFRQQPTQTGQVSLYLRNPKKAHFLMTALSRDVFPSVVTYP